MTKYMERIAAGLNVVGAAGLLTMLVVTTADVVMSKVFNWPFPGATEIVTSVMPICVFAFLLSTQIQKRHITIDMVLNRLKGRSQALLKLGAIGVGVFLFGYLTRLTTPLAIYSYTIGEHTGGNVAVPIYPAKIIIPIATGLVTIQLLIQASRAIRELLSDRNPQGDKV